MDLLPKSRDEFRSAEFWERFFKGRGDKIFDWYGEYPQLCGILHKYVKPTDKILNIGCGTSQLSSDMYDVGYKDVTNIDTSDVALRQMTEKNQVQRPDMKFLKMDIMKMEFKDDQFSTVIDKATLDAIMTDDSDAVSWQVEKMFGEIGRVLRFGGRYVCITLAQDHIVKKILTHFAKEGWPVRVHRVDEEEEGEGSQKEFKLPVFVFILTKFKRMATAPNIFEVSYTNDKVERVDSIDRLQAAVKSLQEYTFIRRSLNKKRKPNEQLSIDLYNSLTSSPRYTLTVVDNNRRCKNKFGVFIVPDGRETEWLFSTSMGRLQLSHSADYQRLIVATLHRDQTYTDMETVKSELSTKVMELAPPGLDKGTQVPFLSVGPDIGKRTIRHRGNSDGNGDFVIEDVDVSGQIFRRLIYLSSPNVIQTEAKLYRAVVKKQRAKKLTKLMVDSTHLSSQYHVAMVAGLAFMEDFQTIIGNGFEVLILGIGGVPLAMYLHNVYQNCHIDVVENDNSLAHISKEHFNLTVDDRMKLHITDPLEFIEKLSVEGKKKHVVVIDVNESEADGDDIVVPPYSYLSAETLQKVDDILSPEGIFLMNLICLDIEKKYDIVKRLKSVFKLICSKKIMELVNEVIYGVPSRRQSCQDIKDEDKLGKNFKRSVRLLQDLVKTRDPKPDIQGQSQGLGHLGLVNMMEDLQIL